MDHFKLIVSRDSLMFPCFKHIIKSFKTTIMQYISIQSYNISCHQNGVFRNVGKFPNLFEKSPESLIYDQHFCINGLGWCLRNSDTFPIGASQLEMTGLQGNFLRRLWILDNRYSFTKLVALKVLEFFIRIYTFSS